MAEVDTNRFMTPGGVLHGFLCPTCERLFETEDEAISCRESHDELGMEPMYAVGQRFPVEITVMRVKGRKIIEIASYKREGEIQKVDMEIKQK